MRLIFIAPSSRHPSGGVAVIYEVAAALARRGHDVHLYHVNFFGATASTMDELRVVLVPRGGHSSFHPRGPQRPPVDSRWRRLLRVLVRPPDGAPIGPPRRAHPGLQDVRRIDRAARVRGSMPQGVRRRLAGRGGTRARRARQRARSRSGRHPPRQVPGDPTDQGASAARLLLLQLAPAEGLRAGHRRRRARSGAPYQVSRWWRSARSRPSRSCRHGSRSSASRRARQLVDEIYNTSRVFLCTSWVEGFGLTNVEAMACGAALVTTDNGGSRDYALHGETALVAPCGDVGSVERVRS